MIGFYPPPHVTAITVLLAALGLWLLNEIWQPFEGRFTIPRWDRPEHTVAEVHGRVIQALESLPAAAVPDDPQVARFLSRLEAAEVTDWADTYCRDFEHNPRVLHEIAEDLQRVISVGHRTGKSAALRKHGMAAAAHVPERHHAEWETAAVLAAWALVLRDDLEPDEFNLLYGPFTAVVPVAAPPLRPAQPR
jgi:hypothetical protein